MRKEGRRCQVARIIILITFITIVVTIVKIHEILVVKKKNLPNDPFYKSVLIKESRRKSTISNDSDSGSEFDDIVDSDD